MPAQVLRPTAFNVEDRDRPRWRRKRRLTVATPIPAGRMWLAAEPANCTASNRPPGSRSTTAPCWQTAPAIQVIDATAQATMYQPRPAPPSRSVPASTVDQCAPIHATANSGTAAARMNVARPGRSRVSATSTCSRPYAMVPIGEPSPRPPGRREPGIVRPTLYRRFPPGDVTTRADRCPCERAGSHRQGVPLVHSECVLTWPPFHDEVRVGCAQFDLTTMQLQFPTALWARLPEVSNYQIAPYAAHPDLLRRLPTTDTHGAPAA